MFYLTTHSTHFIYGYMASEGRKEGNVLFNDALKGYIFTVIWRQKYGNGPLR